MCGATKTTVSASLAFVLAKREEIAKTRRTVDEVVNTTGVILRQMAAGKPELLELIEATEELQYAKSDLDAAIFGVLGRFLNIREHDEDELEMAVVAYNTAKAVHAAAEEAAGPALEGLRREQAFAAFTRDADATLN